jgi:hypothetical protein
LVVRGAGAQESIPRRNGIDVGGTKEQLSGADFLLVAKYRFLLMGKKEGALFAKKSGLPTAVGDICH